jgi:hypothetical protein
MTREEAEHICAQHNAGHPDRGEYRWAARPADGGQWRVVRVRIPGGGLPRNGTPTTEARPSPPYSPDPRPGPFRDAPPYGPGL